MKYIILTLISFILIGCSASVDECKEKKYKGIVVERTSENPSIYCSNGDKSPDEKYYLTDDGEKAIVWYKYFELK